MPAQVARALALAGSLAAALGCNGKRANRTWDPDPPARPDLPVATPVRAASETPHPRILFTAETRKRIRASAAAGSPLWRQLERRCGIFADGDKSAGYLGLQWGEAIGNLTTCYYATGEERYRTRAVDYVRALVNDKQRFGDAEGGNAIIRGNSGYPIRAFGVYAALSYDWLHDAPGMEELRPIILERLKAWLDWYIAEGYLNDSPYSNYFWGYFSALAMAGLTTDGETPDAEAWLAKTQSLLEEKVVPGFHARLKGGEWAEGWQYGQLVAMEVALLVDGYRTATGADYSKRFPWLGEIVHSYLHRMHPDRASVYGNGTQHKRPPPPDPAALSSALLVLAWSDPAVAAQARFLVRQMSPPHGNERLWFAFVADDPGGAEKDPRSPDVLSYHLNGPGQTFLRSSWQDDAVWVSLQAGARVAVDHQQNDQGHFELWRGSDALLSDFATQEGYATINHNSLLIDDGGDVLNYTPNQGVWARKSHTVRWHDGGSAAVVVGDLTDAWAPKCVERGCDQRAVKKVIRTLVYLRPDVVVLDDDMELSKGTYGATWIAHVKALPQIAGARASAVIGGSRVDVHALAPAVIRSVVEPTLQDDHIYRGNRPDGQVWRIEVDTPRGQPSRRIRTWVRAASAGAAPDVVTAISGTGLGGGVGQVGSAKVAVLFAGKPDGGQAVVPPGAARALVVGLAPDATYQVATESLARASIGPGCRLSVTRQPAGKSVPDPGGALSVDLASCGRAE